MTEHGALSDSSPLPVQRPTLVTLHRGHGDPTFSTWQIAVETPVQISINGVPRTVMLATPSALEDLARGLAVTERWVTSPSAIESVEVTSFLNDVTVNVTVDPAHVSVGAHGARTIAGNTGCGLCGIETLAALQARQGSQRSEHHPVRDFAIRRALESLSAHQPLNATTHSVHAAAWCSLDGHVIRSREDVGRHNALDKLIGALASAGQLNDPGFVVMTSRCSYELVYKATAANTQLLATISAPTTMALEWSRALDLPLVSTMHARDGAHVLVHFPSQAAHLPATLHSAHGR